MSDDPPKRPEIKIDTRTSTTVQVKHVDRQDDAPPFGITKLKADLFTSKKPPREGVGQWLIAKASLATFEAAVAEIRELGGVAKEQRPVAVRGE